MKSQRVGALALAIACVGFGNVDAKPKKKAAHHVVTIKGIKFDPPELTVKTGESVEWVNQDILPHTATALGKQFDSGSIPANGRWTWTPKEKGEIPYKCNFHPTMRGMLIVK